MYRSHKIQLDPTNKQATLFSKSAGTARFTYNWALDQLHKDYENWKLNPSLPRPSWMSLNKRLNAIKREQFPWMMEITKCAPQISIANLGTAFQNFFKGNASYPKYKKRGQHDSFKVTVGQFAVNGNKIRLPRIGWVRMHEAYRFPEAKLVSVTISKTAGRWFAAISAEVQDTKLQAPNSTVGIDVGVREYVLSNGSRHEVPRTYRKSERKLRRAQQSLSRKQKGSNNRAKAKLKVANIHYRTANIRKDWLHKLTFDIASNHNVVVIEDLNVKGMVKNRHLAKSISDAAFGEFRRQLEYKVAEYGGQLIVADRWFPSSKLCSACGTKAKSLPLNIREWTCHNCGVHHDRDLNAAINLAAIAGSSSVTACGEFSAAVPGALPPAQAASLKQELDNEQSLEVFV